MRMTKQRLRSKYPVYFSEVFAQHRVSLLLLYGTWGTYFVVLFSRIIRFTQEGLVLGHVNVWSDWALHIGMAHIFASKPPSLWFAYHPMYAGGKFTYPFVTNLVSGLLMRLGLPLELAFILPSIAFVLLLLLGLYALGYIVLRSQRQSLVALSLFFLSAGMGFFGWVRDIIADPSLAQLLYPLKEYSRFDQFQWYSGNVIVGMLLPQRSFLLGLTMAVWILVILFRLLGVRDQRQYHLLSVMAGVGAGLLPIVHTHSFMAVVLISVLACFSQLHAWRSWIWFALPASLVSLMCVSIFIIGGIESSEFMRWSLGWTNTKGVIGWLSQWWLQWGLMLPLALVGLGLTWKSATLPYRVMVMSAVILFCVGNVVLFQPIPWDNAKLFLWAYLGFSFAATSLLAHWWQYRGWGRVVVILATFFLVATGTLEVIRLQAIDRNSFLETARSEIIVGDTIRSTTDPQAIFLTAPVHNHFVMVWGARPILMGYPAWVMNYGFLYHEREQDMQRMYEGRDAEALLARYNITYVVIGPDERRHFMVNDAFYEQYEPPAFRSSTTRIYKVR